MNEFGKSLNTFKNIFIKSNEKKSNPENISQEILDKEISNNPIFKKINNIQTFLQKFSNKTYKLKNEDDNNFEIAIKIEICKVFDYLMDLREEFFIDNLVEFFKESYGSKLKQDYLSTNIGKL